MFTVQLGPITNAYYSSFEMTNEGVFPHAVTGKTPLYYAFATFQAALIISSAVAVYNRRKRTQHPEEKRKLTLLMLESSLPLLSLICTITLNLGGWDPSPFILALLLLVIFGKPKKKSQIDETWEEL